MKTIIFLLFITLVCGCKKDKDLTESVVGVYLGDATYNIEGTPANDIDSISSEVVRVSDNRIGIYGRDSNGDEWFYFEADISEDFKLSIPYYYYAPTGSQPKEITGNPDGVIEGGTLRYQINSFQTGVNVHITFTGTAQ